MSTTLLDMRRFTWLLTVASWMMVVAILVAVSPSGARACTGRGDGCGCTAGRCAHSGCACQDQSGNACSPDALQRQLRDRPAALRALQDDLLADQPASGAREAQQRLVGVPCTEGMAGPYPCKGVDLLAFLPLAEVGGDPAGDGTNDIWGWTDPSTGKEYALLGLRSGTSFIDISNPLDPILLGVLPRHQPSGCSLWRSLKVYSNPETGTHSAFIASEAAGHGLQIFDLTQLRQPAPAGVYTETAWFGGTEENPLTTVHTLAINEETGFLYAAGVGTDSACNRGLYILNVRNPLNVRFAGCFANDGYNHETQCVTYAGPDAEHLGDEICFSSDVDTLTIVDVTNKNRPVQLSRTSYTGSGYTHQTWLTEDQQHLLLDDERDEVNFGHNGRTYIWDVSDLEAPVLTARYTASTTAIDHNQYIRGDFSYQSNYRAGLRILHTGYIADGVLSEVGFFDIWPADDEARFNGTWTNYPFFPSGNVIVSGIEQGLFVLRPNLGPTPTLQSLPSGPNPALQLLVPALVLACLLLFRRRTAGL